LTFARLSTVAREHQVHNPPGASSLPGALQALKTIMEWQSCWVDPTSGPAAAPPSSSWRRSSLSPLPLPIVGQKGGKWNGLASPRIRPWDLDPWNLDRRRWDPGLDEVGEVCHGTDPDARETIGPAIVLRHRGPKRWLSVRLCLMLARRPPRQWPCSASRIFVSDAMFIHSILLEQRLWRSPLVLV
jgi:hypothetical protein